VARWVWSASALTSAATTAKPLPASPARADSMVAFSEEIGLRRDGMDHQDDRADLVRRHAQPLDLTDAEIGALARLPNRQGGPCDFRRHLRERFGDLVGTHVSWRAYADCRMQ
jgi:hypothetical protein